MNYAHISQFRIFAITETWLSSHIYDNEILPSNFIIYRNGQNSRGGGVMLAIDQSISIKTIPSPEDIEAVVVHLTQHSVKLCLVYNPPNSDKLYQQKLISFLSKLNDNIVILGDFNALDIDWLTLSADSGFSIHLCNLIFQYNLTQVITSSTHKHGNILDLVITNNEEIISDIPIHSKNDLLIKSDYYPLSCKAD